ncbi:MAG: segregation/condensation protein A [Candidatus Hydrogenedentota bacterium]|nr:MAG: segregation/condensation protein A [Candidatus Hydrogenedentota bacterium]
MKGTPIGSEIISNARRREGEKSESAPAIRLPEGIKLPDGTRWAGCHVELDRFAGPLDLLLHLVREKKIEIEEINVAEVADQFVSYVAHLEEKAFEEPSVLDTIGDFLVMAATLVQIKLRELLPRDEEADEEEEGMTREELIRLLQEYERFKNAARRLEERKKSRERIFLRNRPLVSVEPEEELKVDLTRLLSAFQTVLARASEEKIQELAREVVRIEDCMIRIRGLLREKRSVVFEELFRSSRSKPLIIGMFLALLEMIKEGEVTVMQEGALGRIRIALPEEA